MDRAAAGQWRPMNSRPVVADTAVQAALARVRRRFSRTILYMVVLCTAIGVLLTAIDGGAPFEHLVYSFAIGFLCWGFTEGGRLAAAVLTDALRRRRGLPPHPSGFEAGWRGIVPGVLLSVLLGPPLGMTLGDWLTGHVTPSLLEWTSTTTRVTLVLTVIGSLASVVVLSTMERLSGARAQAEAAQRQAAEHQLRLLQSQLEPHMLFNTLANLRVLIGLDPPRAQAMLDRLIAYLRATLAASRAERHPLGAEFERIADYLSLMAIRMGPRLSVQLDLPPALAGLPVPPLLLQPLVENSIQHGLEPKVDGGRIVVSAERADGMLRVTVADSGVGPGAAGTAGTGFGLTQVRERLATVYGGRARLELAAAPEGGTRAVISLPLEERA